MSGRGVMPMAQAKTISQQLRAQEQRRERKSVTPEEALTAEPWSQDRKTWNSFDDTRLYSRWRRRVKEGDPNDFVIAVTASSRTGVSGSGKTTSGQSLAKNFDVSEAGYSAEEKGTLDPSELAYGLLPASKPGSAFVLEEAQGTPKSSGLDKRRAMKESVIKTINAILANRDQRLTLIIVAQQLSMIDPRFLPLIDAWLLIRKEPSDPHGPLMTHHKLVVDDYDLRSPSIKTPAVEDLSWPRIPHDDPDYKAMEAKKQVAKQRAGEGEEEEPVPSDPAEMPKEMRDSLIGSMTEAGITQSDIAEILEISQTTVSRAVNN